MTEPAVHLASLIGSRICHDLVSPIGAISNGIELLSLSGPVLSGQSPEMQLLQSSCLNANARIRFFRIAFGSAGGGQHIPKPEVNAILSDLSQGARVSVRWDGDTATTRRIVQIGFLSAMCLENAIPRGGQIVLGNAAGRLTARATGPDIRIDPTLWQHLTTGAPLDATPNHVEFAMLRMLLSDQGGGTRLSHTAEAVLLDLTVPG